MVLNMHLRKNNGIGIVKHLEKKVTKLCLWMIYGIFMAVQKCKRKQSEE